MKYLFFVVCLPYYVRQHLVVFLVNIFSSISTTNFFFAHIFNKLFFLTFLATNYLFHFFSSPPPQISNGASLTFKTMHFLANSIINQWWVDEGHPSATQTQYKPKILWMYYICGVFLSQFRHFFIKINKNERNRMSIRGFSWYSLAYLWITWVSDYSSGPV